MKKAVNKKIKFGHVVHCDAHAIEVRAELGYGPEGCHGMADMMFLFFFEIIFFENGCGRAYK